MSKIGRQKITLPAGVKADITPKAVAITSAKGTLNVPVPACIGVAETDGALVVTMENPNAKNAKALWGTTRAILNNAVAGVSAGFSKKMIVEGVGYRAELKGNDLQLNLGFSHPIIVKQISGIAFAVEKNIITVSGIDKELVGQIAAIIRAYKKPEPYKGKGIHYDNEIVRRKAGKKASS